MHEGIEPYQPLCPLFTHPCLYWVSYLLSLAITCPAKPTACRPWSQALPLAKAPNRALLGPSSRGAKDLLSSLFSFPRTPGLCSDLLFAGFRSHRISPGGQTTLVYARAITARQSSPVSSRTNKRCLQQRDILSPILSEGGGQDAHQASTQAQDSIFTLEHASWASHHTTIRSPRLHGCVPMRVTCVFEDRLTVSLDYESKCLPVVRITATENV